MSVRSSVVTALADTALPVYWQKWSGDTDPPASYFVFTTMTMPDEWFDDAQQSRKTYVYLNLYSQTDYAALLPTIRTGMAAAGFYPVDERDIPDDNYTAGAHDSYHLHMAWYLLEDV